MAPGSIPMAALVIASRVSSNRTRPLKFLMLRDRNKIFPEFALASGWISCGVLNWIPSARFSLCCSIAIALLNPSGYGTSSTNLRSCSYAIVFVPYGS